jgi:magnesium-transporting ATPase (P-type)
MNLEDRAISNFLSSLGFQIACMKSAEENSIDEDGISLNKYSTFYLSSRYFNSRQEFDLICVNSLTKNRAKMSLIVRDTYKTDEYLLIVKGDDTSFRNCFNMQTMGAKELNQYKSLLSDYKVKGFKRIVIGCKALTKDEVEEYLAVYNTICDSSREQLEAFENHARKIETDLFFVGCIGVKDIIREDAIHLADSFNKAKIQSNILSGDTLDNCLTLAKEIGLTKAKFNDTSTYFSLSFSTEVQGSRDLRRILEHLYETIVDNNMENIDKMLESEKKNEKKSKTRFKDLFSLKGGVAQLMTEKQKEDDEKEIISDVRLKKTLLINGKSMPIIMKSRLLSDYFKVVLLFSDCIIGYAMKPNHKAAVVKLTRELGKTVMAVGDGLNDLGMFSESDISIQLCNKDVHIALADIQVGDLETIETLMFYFGAKLNRNLMLGLVLSFWFTFSWACLQIYFFTIHMYSRSFFSTFQVVSAIVAFSTVLIVLMATDEAHTDEFLKQYPVMYFSQKIGATHLGKMLVAVIAINVFQAYFLFSLTGFLMSNTMASDGNKYPYTVASHLAICALLLSNIINIYFAVARKNLYHHIGVSLVLVSIMGYFHIEVALITVTPIDAIYADFLGNPNLWGFIGYYFLSAIVFNWIFISIFNNKYFNPFNRIIALHLKGRNFNAFKESFPALVYKHIRKLVPNEMKLQMLTEIRKAITRLTLSDSTIQKLLSIDFLNYSWPINWFHRLKDPSERRRFLKVRSKGGNTNLRRYILVTIVLAVLEYLLLILSTDFRRNYYLDSPSLYFIFFCFIILMLSFADLGIKYMRKIINLLFTIFVVVEVVYLFTNSVIPYRYSFIVAGRLIMAPMSSDFLYLSSLSIFRDVCYSIT